MFVILTERPKVARIWLLQIFHISYYPADAGHASVLRLIVLYQQYMITGESQRIMKTYSLIMLKALMLMFTMTVPAHSAPSAEAQEGEASFYADSLHGNKTASGEPYDKGALTAAHRSLPFGTKVKVTYLKTGKSVVVVINDRGPHVKNRIIDLSRAAARKIGLVEAGHGKVKLEILKP